MVYIMSSAINLYTMVSVTDQLQLLHLYTVLMTIKTVLYHRKKLLRLTILIVIYHCIIRYDHKLISQTSMEGLSLY